MECPLIPLSDINVLLVDDERVSRLLVGNTLRRCGYQVTTAAGGEEAIELLEANPDSFSLILSDVMMPGVDGVQLLTYVRGNPRLNDVPVLMVSANEHESTVLECIRNGAEDYLLKPVTKKEVQYIWQHVWRRRAANCVPSEEWETEAEEVRLNRTRRISSFHGTALDFSKEVQSGLPGTHNSAKKDIQSPASGGACGPVIPSDSGSSMPMSGKVGTAPMRHHPIKETGAPGAQSLCLTLGASKATADVDPGVGLYGIETTSEGKCLRRFRVLSEQDDCGGQSHPGCEKDKFQGRMGMLADDKAGRKSGLLCVGRPGGTGLMSKAWVSHQSYLKWPPGRWVNHREGTEMTTGGVPTAPSYVRGMEALPAPTTDERVSGPKRCISRDMLMRQQLAAMSWESEEQAPRSPTSLCAPPSCSQLPAEGKGMQAWGDFTGGRNSDGLWVARQEAEEARQQLVKHHPQRLHPQGRMCGIQWWSLPDENEHPELTRQQWLHPTRSNSELRSHPSRSPSQQSQPVQYQHMEAGRAQLALNDQQLLLEQTQQMLNLCKEQGEELHRHNLFSGEKTELEEMDEDGRSGAMQFPDGGMRSCSVENGSQLREDRLEDADEGWERDEWNWQDANMHCGRSLSRDAEKVEVHLSRLCSADGSGRESEPPIVEEEDARGGSGGRRFFGFQTGTRVDEWASRSASPETVGMQGRCFEAGVGRVQEPTGVPEQSLRSYGGAGPSVSERSHSPKTWLSESAGGSQSQSRSCKDGKSSDSARVSAGGKNLADKGSGSGLTMRQWLNRPGRRVELRECLHIVLQVVRLLSPLHSEGLALRQLRPSKLFLSGNCVTLMDAKSSVPGEGEEKDKSEVLLSCRVSQPGEAQSVGSPSWRYNLKECLLRQGGGHHEGEEPVGRRMTGSAGESSLGTMLNLNSKVGEMHQRRLEGGKHESGSVSMHGVGEAERWDRKAGTEGSSGRRCEKESLGARSEETGAWRGVVVGQPERVLRSRLCDGARIRSASGEGGMNVSGSSGSGKGSLLRGGLLEKKVLDEGERKRRVEAVEQKWYSSPEELTGGQVSPASDMYSLGVLFFELLCPPMRLSELARVMSDLRHRILPPNFLSERPKEAAFCLWLLHPEPSSRPKSRDVLSCELMSDTVKILAEQEAAANLEAECAEIDVLLDFLTEVQTGKEAAATRLEEDLQRLTADIDEIQRRRLHNQAGCSEERQGQWLVAATAAQGDRPSDTRGQVMRQLIRKRPRDEYEEDSSCRVEVELKPRVLEGDVKRWCTGVGVDEKYEQRSERVMNNFENLEEAYFSMRWQLETKAEGCSRDNRLGRGASVNGRAMGVKDVKTDPAVGFEPGRAGGVGTSDVLGCFFDSLCKFARYSKFKVKATLRHGDLLSTSNMVCSLSFDKDEEYFASAGVCKRVKIFGLDTVLSDGVGVHYPVAEMASRSKLSCICWNSYIKSHIASSDYEGHVQLWDASTGQPVVEYEEHEKRTWSVDFSRLDPKHLASGSDDGTVKLWSINQEASVATIKTKANVCCVQFSPDSAHTLAFGSADYKVYTYDWRHTRSPLAVFSGHRKAVSYVKFADANTFVSASTDNTLKLWDLKRGIEDCSGGLTTSSEACTLTYTGHTNEKNFVGLTVADGYIACGSETNSVFAYHRSLHMPMVSHQFGSMDPVTGAETEDDGGQFVSSVCWRGKTQTLVAANSMGNIKILEML